MHQKISILRSFACELAYSNNLRKTRNYSYPNEALFSRPTHDIHLFQVAIVVPFRDRHEHLYIFLRHMHQFLRWQMLEYRIFIVEQVITVYQNTGV